MGNTTTVRNSHNRRACIMHFELSIFLFNVYYTGKDKCFTKINNYLFKVLNYTELVSYNFAQHKIVRRNLSI